MDSTVETIVKPAPKQRTDNIGKWHGTLEELARDMGGMRYDRLAQLFSLLVKEMQNQSASIHDNRILSARLGMAAHNLEVVKHDMLAASKA